MQLKIGIAILNAGAIKTKERQSKIGLEKSRIIDFWSNTILSSKYPYPKDSLLNRILTPYKARILNVEQVMNTSVIVIMCPKKSKEPSHFS